jgi:hypothetical protein
VAQLKTGAFTQPRQMLQVPPGELLEVISGAVQVSDDS